MCDLNDRESDDLRWQQLTCLICEVLSEEDPCCNGLPLAQLNVSLSDAAELIKDLAIGRGDVVIGRRPEAIILPLEKERFDMFQREGVSGWLIRLKNTQQHLAAAPIGDLGLVRRSRKDAQENAVVVSVLSVAGDTIFGPERLPATSPLKLVRSAIESSRSYQTCKVELLDGTRVLPDDALLQDIQCAQRGEVTLSAAFVAMMTRRATNSLFVFGALSADEVLRAMMYRIPKKCPARLHGFSLCSARQTRSRHDRDPSSKKGEDDLAICCSETVESYVDGMLIEDLNDIQLEAVHFCEDGRSQSVSVVAQSTETGMSELVETKALNVMSSLPESHRLTQEWSYKDFRTRRMYSYIKDVVRPLCEELTAERAWAQRESREC